MDEEKKEGRAETPEEKVDRCDGFVDFGPLDRSMMRTKVAQKLAGEGASWEKVNEIANGFDPEFRDRIYRTCLMAKGVPEDRLEAAMDIPMFDDDPWIAWHEKNKAAK